MKRPEKAKLRAPNFTVNDIFSKRNPCSIYGAQFTMKNNAAFQHHHKTYTNQIKSIKQVIPVIPAHQILTDMQTLKRLASTSGNTKMPKLQIEEHNQKTKNHNTKLINEVYKSATKANMERPKGYSKADVGSVINQNNRNFQNNMSYSKTIETTRLNTLPFSPIKINYWENKCRCTKFPSSPFCLRAQQWFENAKKYKHNENFDQSTMKVRYFNIVNSNIEIDPEVTVQISRDVTRTFPKHPLFSGKSIGLQVLARILTTYAKYASHIGYVQGMNFICGSLLYHCTEEAAFWMFVMIMEDYDLEEVYTKGLPGLYKHTFMIEKLLSAQKPLEDVFEQLKAHQIKADMFATDWIFTLFTNIIPIEGDFYDIFFRESWPFFYKLLFSILKSSRKEILEGEDLGDILSPIRCKSEENASLLSKVKSLLWSQSSFWGDCLKDCSIFKFNEKQVLLELSTM